MQTENVHNTITLKILCQWPDGKLKDVYAIQHNRKYHCQQRQQHFN